MSTSTLSAQAPKSNAPGQAGEMPRAEHPRPDMLREQWMNLNGTWEFEIDNGVSGEERKLFEAASLSQKILVPFCPESDLSGIGNKDFMPCVWYRRTVTIPKEWAGKRVLLHFGACDYDTTVWVNGEKAGTHRGGYASFTFDVTKLLKEGENVLVVKALDNTRDPLQPKGKQCDKYASYGCLYTRTTGIWQTVWLEAVPTAYIRSYKCFPNLAEKCVQLHVKVDGNLKGGKLTAEVVAEGKTVACAQTPVRGAVQFSIALPEVRTWGPEDPFLYDLNLKLEGEGQQADVVKSYFGMREVAIDGYKVLLNGKSVFQRLVLDQGFYPDGIYTAPSDQALKADIEMSMAMGFNGARLHEKIFESRFLYWADKLGYLVWGEYPNWGLDHAAPLALERVTVEWLETLERDFNHPAIVGWCPFNETPLNQNPELLRMVYRTTKLVDDTRPCIDSSGWLHVETDIYDVHDYEQVPEKFAEHYDPMLSGGKVRQNFPDLDAAYRDGQPYFVSEYGGIWWGVDEENSWGYGERPKSEQEMLGRYRALTTYLLKHPMMFGFCYTQLTDVEQEQNGLYTYKRKAKFDPAIIKAINSQPAAIEAE